MNKEIGMKLSLFTLLIVTTLSNIASADWFDSADPAVIYANALPVFSANKNIAVNEIQSQDLVNEGKVIDVPWDFELGSKPNYPVNLFDNRLTVKNTYPSLNELRVLGVISNEVGRSQIEKFIVSTYTTPMKPAVAPSFDEVLREMEQQRRQDVALQQQKSKERAELPRAYYVKQDVFNSSF